MPTRLEEIKSFVEMAPGDPFPLYGLAMEYRTLGDVAEARQAFGRLAEKFPGYVAQYLMHAKMLVEHGEKAAARQVLTVGIAEAQKGRNHHALGELQAELQRERRRRASTRRVAARKAPSDSALRARRLDRPAVHSGQNRLATLAMSRGSAGLRQSRRRG